jgi:hypothetical protein
VDEAPNYPSFPVKRERAQEQEYDEVSPVAEAGGAHARASPALCPVKREGPAVSDDSMRSSKRVAVGEVDEGRTFRPAELEMDAEVQAVMEVVEAEPPAQEPPVNESPVQEPAANEPPAQEPVPPAQAGWLGAFVAAKATRLLGWGRDLVRGNNGR